MGRKKTAEILPRDMTERQLRTHALLLEFQTYPLWELAERWGKSEDTIRRMAHRYNIGKADDYQLQAKRKPVVQKNVAAVRLAKRRTKELQAELLSRQVAEMYPFISKKAITKELGITINQLDYIIRKNKRKKSIAL